MTRAERALAALVRAALAFDSDPSPVNRAALKQRAAEGNAVLPEEDRAGYEPPVVPVTAAPGTPEHAAQDARYKEQLARKAQWDKSRAQGHQR